MNTRHTPHGAPRLFLQEKAHENGRGCDTQRTEAGPFTRLVAWLVYALALLVAPSLFPATFELTNGTDVALRYTLYSSQHMHVPAQSSVVYDVPWQGNTNLYVAWFNASGSAVNVVNQWVDGGNVRYRVAVYSLHDGATNVVKPLTSVDRYLAYMQNPVVAMKLPGSDADTESMVTGFQFAVVLGFGFLLMWVFRRMHGNINHNQP